VKNDFIDFSIIDSELKAYLIGFFYADATLTDYCITIRLSIKDKDQVEKLANLLNKPTFERDIKNKNGKIYRCSGFNICNKKSVDSLRKIGFIKNKTYQIDDVVFKKNERYWRLIYSGNRISKKILDFLYDNSSIFMNRKHKEYLKIVEYKPIGYHYHNKSGYWRVPYKDENNIQKWRKFKNEIDAQDFSEKIKNEPTYKVVIKEYKPKGYSQTCIVEYKDENNIRKHKVFKNEIEAQNFLDKIKNDIRYKVKDNYYQYWRVPYQNENGVKMSKNFKTEIDAQKFLQEIKNKNNKIIKTYEKFISKMVK